MVARMPTGIDYLSARLHARRGQLAEGERLDALCRLRTIPELARALFPNTPLQSSIELQRRLVFEQVRELTDLARMIEGPAGNAIDWLCMRYRLENLKVLARAFVTRTPFVEVRQYLVPIPGEEAYDDAALANADTVETFAELLPHKAFQAGIEYVLPLFHAQPRAFILEAALDRAYFIELMDRTKRLGDDDREDILTLVRQDLDVFTMLLVVRGKFHYGLKNEVILPFYMAECDISYLRFGGMLASTDLAAVAAKCVGRAIDSLPPEFAGAAGTSRTLDPVVLEVLARNRSLRVANRVFRRSPMGLGVIYGYAGVRRAELGNLITLIEGIRAGMTPEVIRRRLVPRIDLEAAHV